MFNHQIPRSLRNVDVALLLQQKPSFRNQNQYSFDFQLFEVFNQSQRLPFPIYTQHTRDVKNFATHASNNENYQHQNYHPTVTRGYHYFISSKLNLKTQSSTELRKISFMSLFITLICFHLSIPRFKYMKSLQFVILIKIDLLETVPLSPITC